MPQTSLIVAVRLLMVVIICSKQLFGHNSPHMVIGDVCQADISYILKHYGLKCTVAFDGYGNVSSTEAAEQRRRAEKCTSSDTILTSTWQQHHPKQQRKRLIHFLRQMMLTAGIYVKQADGDADSLIVSTALFFITVRRPSSCCCCRDRQIYWTC